MRRAALGAVLALVASACAPPSAIAPRPTATGQVEAGSVESPLDPEEVAFLARPEAERVAAVRAADRVLANESADAVSVASAELELERALRDEHEVRGLWLMGCGLLRIQDLAARALGPRVGVDFRCFWPSYERDRAAARISNVLRARRGLAARSVPALPIIAPADADDVSQARAALLAARDDAQARAALATYAEMGLSGLAPLRQAVRALPTGHAAHRLAPPALAQLASTIREVRIEDDGAPLPAEARFVAGEALTPDALIAHLRAAYAARPHGGVGVRINRDANGLGVSIVIRSVLGTPLSSPTSWVHYQESYFEPLSPSAGFTLDRAGGAPGSGEESGATSRVLRTLEWLVKAPPEVAGELRISMIWPTARTPPTPEHEAEIRRLTGSQRASPPALGVGEFERACGAPPPVRSYPDETTLPEVGACPPTPMTWTIPATEMDRNYGRTVGPGLCFGVVHFGRTGQAVEGCHTFHCSTLRYCDGRERAHHCTILAECRNGVPVATGFSW